MKKKTWTDEIENKNDTVKKKTHYCKPITSVKSRKQTTFADWKINYSGTHITKMRQYSFNFVLSGSQTSSFRLIHLTLLLSGLMEIQQCLWGMPGNIVPRLNRPRWTFPRCLKQNLKSQNICHYNTCLSNALFQRLLHVTPFKLDMSTYFSAFLDEQTVWYVSG